MRVLTSNTSVRPHGPASETWPLRSLRGRPGHWHFCTRRLHSLDTDPGAGRQGKQAWPLSPGGLIYKAPPPPPAKPCSPSVITRGRSRPGPHGEVASRERTPTRGRQATHRDLRGGVVMWGVGDRPAQLPGAPAWDVGTDPEVLLGVLVPRRPLLQAPPLGVCP